ncbi:deoxynucleoside kinase [bacterium]|nr:deoxynucleoside kinase [bacterium]
MLLPENWRIIVANHFVAISGNIGVGKTTITSHIAEKLGWKPFFEPVIDNPYLDDFYADMKTWSFHLQVYFLSKRFEAQRDISESREHCIQDRTIYEDVEIFARTLHLQGFMNARDHENYKALFDIMVKTLRKPDLIIYLRANVDNLLERISKRGRDSEKSIDPNYLKELNRAYEGWSERARKICPVLVIETDQLGPEFEGGVADKAIEDIKDRFGMIF